MFDKSSIHIRLAAVAVAAMILVSSAANVKRSASVRSAPAKNKALLGPSEKQYQTCLSPITTYKTPAYGGHGGGHFDDTHYIPIGAKVRKIGIRSGSRIDKISYYTQYTSYHHGGNGGGYREMSLGSTEKVTSVHVCWAHHRSIRIFYIRFRTNWGRQLYGGRGTRYCATATIPADKVFVGLYGRRGNAIDSIGFLYRHPVC